MSKTFLFLAGLNGGLAVAMGAFGAHGLRPRLSAELLAVYHTGAQYHVYHALALGLVALALRASPESLWWRAAGWLFVAGIVLFSGSLYLLAVSGQRWLGMITPLGGGAFLLGWTLFCVGALRAYSS